LLWFDREHKLTKSFNDNGEFLTIVDNTSLLGAGTYYYQVYITKNLLRRTIQSGAVEAVINYAASPDFDGRNQLEKDLEIINQAIRSVVSGGAILLDPGAFLV
jgi:hypothetical protein